MARLLWVVVIALAVLGVIGTVGRAAVLLHEPDFWDTFFARHPEWGFGNLDDQRFARHWGVTFAHLISAFLFAVLAPLQFVGRIRAKRPRLHRLAGRVLVVAATCLGVTGVMLGLTTALEFGGISESVPVLLFATVFLFSLGRAVACIRHGDPARHREWMIRVLAIGLAAGTDRIIGLPFLLSAEVRQAPAAFIGISFWIAFLLNVSVGEAWIVYTRPASEPDLLPVAPPV